MALIRTKSTQLITSVFFREIINDFQDRNIKKHEDS